MKHFRLLNEFQMLKYFNNKSKLESENTPSQADPTGLDDKPKALW